MAPISPTPPAVGLISQLGQGINKRNFDRAISDILVGLQRWPLWGTMGTQEIRHRYRRSRIGPFWLTISMGITVVALGLLYGSIFNRNLSDYLPYLSAGFVIWSLISHMILDGVRSFIAREGIIKQLPAPFSIHVYHVCWTNLIIFGHNLIIFFLVFLWFGHYPNLNLLLVIPAVFLLVINGAWMGLFLVLLSARFRDIPQITSSIVQVMFFITPVIWKQDMLPDRAIILAANPFYYLLEIVRAPLLGTLPSLQIIIGTLAITLLGWALTLFVFTALRWRLPYWL